MGMEMAGNNFAPALYVLKLPVALAGAPGKIAIRQRLPCVGCYPDTKKAGKKTKKKCLECLLVVESYVSVQTH